MPSASHPVHQRPKKHHSPLSRDEMKRLRRKFRALDADKSGSIDRGASFPPLCVHAFVHESISPPFISLFCLGGHVPFFAVFFYSAEFKDLIAEVFGDAEIMGQAAHGAAVPLEEDLEILFQEADVDHSGSIDFEEFLELYQKARGGALNIGNIKHQTRSHTHTHTLTHAHPPPGHVSFPSSITHHHTQ